MHPRDAADGTARAGIAICPDREKFRAEYPEVEDEDIHQALEYDTANLDDKVVELRPVA